ncbi:MAG: S8A family peptidase [Candidatus Woesebacteria bacterium GW2011_GWB1_39_12]|uniref:S8A family peptidase n=1 Tax=Candidatus Woesebacteria bacterium GW2011_GWB1_39_12 TaxID=1618574 RepID=A0A0G0PM11_9BACT|nr:MAG: S8A family peptidase [Candidatus Woesebacteria bacterium GW2011_GWB1_39_12]
MELVIKLKNPRDGYAQLLQVERSHGMHFRSNSLLGQDTGIFRAEIPAMAINKVDDLRDDSRIQHVEQNRILGLMPNESAIAVNTDPNKRPKKPNDPLYPKQWHLDMIEMPKAWQRSTGKGAVVAVLDTGVAFKCLAKDRPHLADLDSRRCVEPYNATNGSKDAWDGMGHGSHVSGTVGQDTDNGYGCAGVAPDSRIMPVKVLTDQGYGSISDIADGIYYAVKKGAHVISMSLGGTGYSPVLHQACKDAHKAGVLVVAAAGNNGDDEPHYPAAYPEVMAVSAVGPDAIITEYSSYGDFVNIAAPGGNTRKFGEDGGVLQESVYQGKAQFVSWNGTSMSCPSVSGTAALLIQKGVKGSDRLWEVITSSAVDRGDPYKYGSGLLNAWNALTK